MTHYRLQGLICLTWIGKYLLELKALKLAAAAWSKSKRWAAPLRAVFDPRFHSPLPAKEEWAWDRDLLEFGRARLLRFLVAPTRIYLGSHWFIKFITILLLAIVVALSKASSSQGTDCELQKWPCYRVNYLWASTTSFFIFFITYSSSPLQLDSKCNQACNCTGVNYDPVCGGPLTYFSPCYAGCDQNENQNKVWPFGPFAFSEKQYLLAF